MIDRQEINKLVAAGELEEAARRLEEALQEKKRLQHFAVQLQRRLQAVRQRELRGTLSREDADVERARVSEGLLFLAAHAGDDAVVIPDELTEAFQEPGSSRRLWARITFLGIALTAAIAVVVYLAFLRPQGSDTFDLKTYIQQVDGPSGSLAGAQVKLVIGDYQTPARSLDEEGLVIFNDIARAFERDTVTLLPVGVRWEVVGQSVATAAESANRSITFQVRPIPDSTLWRGIVVTTDQRPVAGVEVIISDGLARATSDDRGEFAMKVPLSAGTTAPVKAWKEGLLVFNRQVVISAAQSAEIIINAN